MNIVSMDDLADIVESSADVVGVLCPRAKEACEAEYTGNVYMCNMHMQYDFTALNQVDKISSDFSYSFKSWLMFIAVFRFFAHITVDLWIRPCLHNGRCSKIWVPLKSIGFLLIFYTSKCKKPTILRSIWGTRLGVFSPKNSPTYFMMSLIPNWMSVDVIPVWFNKWIAQARDWAAIFFSSLGVKVDTMAVEMVGMCLFWTKIMLVAGNSSTCT